MSQRKAAVLFKNSTQFPCATVYSVVLFNIYFLQRRTEQKILMVMDFKEFCGSVLAWLIWASKNNSKQLNCDNNVTLIIICNGMSCNIVIKHVTSVLLRLDIYYTFTVQIWV